MPRRSVSISTFLLANLYQYAFTHYPVPGGFIREPEPSDFLGAVRHPFTNLPTLEILKYRAFCVNPLWIRTTVVFCIDWRSSISIAFYR